MCFDMKTKNPHMWVEFKIFVNHYAVKIFRWLRKVCLVICNFYPVGLVGNGANRFTRNLGSILDICRSNFTGTCFMYTILLMIRYIIKIKIKGIVIKFLLKVDCFYTKQKGNSVWWHLTIQLTSMKSWIYFALKCFGAVLSLYMN